MQSKQQSKHEDIDNRMRLSHEMSKFFKKAYNMFADPQALIGKNLTTTTFWFYLDSLFFNNDKNEDVKAQVRKYEKMHTHEFDELQDLQFILKIRKLVSQQNMGTLNLCDIRSTPIDEVINILECHSQKIQNQNNNLLDHLKIKETQEKQKLNEQLKVFNVKPRECHPMFVYEQFESQLRNRWKIQDKRMENKDKCFLCSKPNKLITCNSCSLKVHPSCYPSLTHRFDSKINRPTEEELKSFVCENCVNKVNSETQMCELCCCIGGHFVKLNYEQENEEENFDFKFLKQNQVQNGNKTPHSTHVQLKVKHNQQNFKEPNKFVHLTCFIWNTDLKWNEEQNLAGGLDIIGKRKHHGICSLCGISFGSAIPCSNQACRRFYHGECAKRNGLEMNLIRAKTSVIQLFCERHRHLNRYESIEEASINKFREVKKMFDGVDKEIKRLHVTASYQQVKLVVERDYCSVCGKEQGREKTTICKQCRKWYHHGCSSNCKNCA